MKRNLWRSRCRGDKKRESLRFAVDAKGRIRKEAGPSLSFPTREKARRLLRCGADQRVPPFGDQRSFEVVCGSSASRRHG